MIIKKLFCFVLLISFLFAATPYSFGATVEELRDSLKTVNKELVKNRKAKNQKNVDILQKKKDAILKEWFALKEKMMKEAASK